MPVESVNQFYQEVMQEPALLQQFQAVRDRESLVNLAVEVAQQKGYSFTVDEVKQALTAQSSAGEAQELSDQQLEAVAGGREKFSWGGNNEQPPPQSVSVVRYSGEGSWTC
ncbi:MAG TPA: Nif11-like leader peptide family natural product precursor [Cyanobacteria bacterium UBA8553]|nr:Nif11-like leader peptide family natural product precursor [Cyanobacteria bacterium UBA8553]